MKLRNPITKLITFTMAVIALVYASGLQQPVNGQTGDGSVRSVSYTSLGIVPGQTVRLSVASDERSVGTMSWSFSYYLAPGSNSSYSAGRLLTQTDPVELRPGHAHTVEIKRDDLRVAGEEVMKRLQVRAGFQVALMDGSVRNVNIPAWLELVDTATGTTQGGSYYTGTVTVSSDGF